MLDILCTPIRNIKVHQLHEFAICTSTQSGNERWELMSKLVQFTAVHFSDPNSNSYGKQSNMKLDLNVSLKVNLNLNNKSRQFENQGNYMNFNYWLSETLRTWAIAILVMHLLWLSPSHLFKILQNVRSIINVNGDNINLWKLSLGSTFLKWNLTALIRLLHMYFITSTILLWLVCLMSPRLTLKRLVFRKLYIVKRRWNPVF